MKVLILYPALQLLNIKPLGVSMLSAVLKRDGHEVMFFNTSYYNQDRILPCASMNEKDIYSPNWFKRAKSKLPIPDTMHIDVVEALNRSLEVFQPNVILVSTAFVSFTLGYKLITLSDARGRLVIYGGIHCTTNPELAISNENVKYIHLGEGEISIPAILSKLQANESIDNCDNLWVKNGSGQIKKNKLVELIKDLGELPFYDFDIYANESYFVRPFLGNIYRAADYSMSRGCFKRCTYCFYKNFRDAYGIRENTIRRYSPERAIEELVYLKERYKITLIKFFDSDFLSVGATYLDEFSKLYKRYIDLPNASTGCIDHVTEKKAKYLVRMGCRSISVGLESGNENIRKRLLNRNYSNKLFLERVKCLRNVGIRVTTANIIGFPTETKKNMLETIMLNKKARAAHQDFNIFFPFPNLELTKYSIEKGYLEKDIKLDSYIYPLETPLKLEISHEQMQNLNRCAKLYATLPFFFIPMIRYAERYNTRDGLVWRFLRRVYFIKLHYLDFAGLIRRIRWEWTVRKLSRGQ